LVSSIRSVKLFPATDIPYTNAFSIVFLLDYGCKDKQKNESSQGCGPQTCELLILFCKSGI
jgi:hypothetical protein